MPGYDAKMSGSAGSRTMTAHEAKRIAIAAQGFGCREALLPMIHRLGVLQIDSVNVLARAHYLPLFARLGPYDRAKLDALAWGDSKRMLFEYWGHQASLLPVEMYSLFTWRMERAVRGEGTWGRIARYAKEKRAYLKRVLAIVRDRGPTTASELSLLSPGEKKKSGWWEWSEAKHAVETLFWQGKLAVASRRASFERVYDLPERVIPDVHRRGPHWSAAEAHRFLLEGSARALGVGTEDDLCDYFRLARAESRPRLRELEEEGVLERVDVEGWDKPAWLHSSARARQRRLGRREVAALVGPFDPIVWHRPRALRMFGFHYRIGIYTPSHQRTHGYYVMPFLLGDALVARVDLKADRAAGALRVQAAWLEEGCDAAVAGPLAAELRRMAGWLGLDEIVVARKGTLAAALRSSVRA